MPNPKAQYEVEITRTGTGAQQAQQDLRNIDSAAAKTGASVASVGKEFKNLAVFLAGSAFLRESVRQFEEHERATAKLNTALKAAGQFTPALAAEMQELARALSSVTEFDNAAVENVIAKLISFGASSKDVGALAEAVLDLSVLFDKDLNRAVLAMGQALRGEFGQFQQFGFAVNEAMTPAAQFNEVLKQLNDRFGGQARAAIQGSLGQLSEAKKAFADLQESAGAAAVSVVSVINALANFVAGPTAADLKNAGPGALPKPIRPGVAGGAGFTQPRVGGSSDAGAAVLRNFQASQPGAAPAATATEITETPEMARRRIEAAREMLEKLTQQHIAAEQVREQAALQFAQQREAGLRTMIEERRSLEQAAALERLEGEKRVAAEIEFNHVNRVARIQEIKGLDDDEYATLLDWEQRLTAAQRHRYQQSLTFGGRLRADFRQIGQVAQETFAQGLAGALVDAFEQGNRAFSAFARNFLRTMAQMILQAIILRAIQSGVDAIFGGGGGSGPASAALDADIDAGSSISFQKLSTLAPRRLNIGDFSPSIGQSALAGRSLALASAGIAGGGVGGAMHLRVTMSPEVKAEVVSTSVKGAVVAVTHEMGRDTKLSRLTKKLTT